MLDADSPLTQRPRRVIVAGVSGTGKTTLATRIASVIDAPHVEIDGLFHGPNWTPRPEFLDDVRALVARPAWVTEWQYSTARDLLAEHADLLVWLDLPFRQTLGRVTRRTVRRRLTREVLWNGNIEPPLRTVLTDREHVVRWAVSTRRKYHELVPGAVGLSPDLVVVRLRSQAEVERWLMTLAASS